MLLGARASNLGAFLRGTPRDVDGPDLDRREWSIQPGGHEVVSCQGILYRSLSRHNEHPPRAPRGTLMDGLDRRECTNQPGGH
jgi:hypothetical protein